MKRMKTTLMLLTFIAAPLASGLGQRSDDNPHCQQVGGAFLTNLGVIDGSTTLGVATGDLRGALAATILNISNEPDNTVVFTVQHHLVTDSGDTITVDVAHAVASPVAPGLLGIVSYPITISGGTGRFRGAHGQINNIGEVDLNTGHTVFRYSGKVCFAHVSGAVAGH